jgi:pyruvate ferredoxin oxidoreductase beta subunit
MESIQKTASKKSKLAGGHRLCPGCGIGLILKHVLSATDDPIVTANATGCSEICFSPYPYGSFRSPWIHSLFENAATVISGVEAAHKSLLKKKKLTKEQENIKFLAIGGDGATYDIGFQWLSGAVERGHNFTYLCFDNEGYMNTGYQRSGSTPMGFSTHTSPDGDVIHGKIQHRKNITRILAAHDIPYAAQASPSHFLDLQNKARKAFATKGPAFLNAFSPCPTNWKHSPADGMEVAKLAVESGFWPLYEVENGKWKLNFRPTKIDEKFEEFCAMQKRTQHLLKKENIKLYEELKRKIRADLDFLEKMEKL